MCCKYIAIYIRWVLLNETKHQQKFSTQHGLICAGRHAEHWLMNLFRFRNQSSVLFFCAFFIFYNRLSSVVVAGYLHWDFAARSCIPCKLIYNTWHSLKRLCFSFWFHLVALPFVIWWEKVFFFVQLFFSCNKRDSWCKHRIFCVIVIWNIQ